MGVNSVNKGKRNRKRQRHINSLTRDATPVWAGRFEGTMNERALRFSTSFPFDKRLYRFDILASIAHVEMLGAQGILRQDEALQIATALRSILNDIETGKLSLEGADEDIHSFVERVLTERIGELGGKLHTARSRNDQVATDVRLWTRWALGQLAGAVHKVASALVEQAHRHIDTLMPGFTHLQHAQPIRLAHHLLAYFWMFMRDAERLREIYKRVNVSPLGAGALAGVDFPIDPQRTARALGFTRCADNSIDAVSDRDFAIEFVSCCSIIMVHLSRLGEELVLWSTPEFGFVILDDAFCTGSSIMPQKKNPDIAELIRGKCGRVAGHLTALIMLLKGLPLSYNRDLQEDKMALFDAFDTTYESLQLMADVITTAQFQPHRMRNALRGDFSTATDLANALVRKGIPCRQAHAIVGKLVRDLLEQGRTFDE
ncbi:MAG TPA: argininosuccinate lyase, partial [Armatimonadetes bacterium]|nr:argininosuccinate lyase [Armatimonadota bacterium]